MWIDPTTPNLADFTTFAIGQGCPALDLPAAPAPPYAEWALNQALAQVIGDDSVGVQFPILYVLAVYNCAMHILVKIGQDVPGQTFFTDTRTALKMSSFLGGVVLASGDESTSQTLAVPESLKMMTLRDLGLIKTPWGREYMEYMQMYGPNVAVMV